MVNLTIKDQQGHYICEKRTIYTRRIVKTDVFQSYSFKRN